MSIINTVARKPYLSVNLSLAIVILAIILYSVLFSPDKNNYPIHSFHDRYTGQSSLSTGMSRAFSCIVRGRFEEAQNYNPYSKGIFSFLVIQFILRIVLILYNRKIDGDNNIAVIVDSVISSSLFLLYFHPFIIEALKLR